MEQWVRLHTAANNVATSFVVLIIVFPCYLTEVLVLLLLTNNMYVTSQINGLLLLIVFFSTRFIYRWSR